jgi:hypothetical protein
MRVRILFHPNRTAPDQIKRRRGKMKVGQRPKVSLMAKYEKEAPDFPRRLPLSDGSP